MTSTEHFMHFMQQSSNTWTIDRTSLCHHHRALEQTFRLDCLKCRLLCSPGLSGLRGLVSVREFYPGVWRSEACPGLQHLATLFSSLIILLWYKNAVFSLAPPEVIVQARLVGTVFSGSAPSQEGDGETFNRGEPGRRCCSWLGSKQFSTVLLCVAVISFQFVLCVIVSFCCWWFLLLWVCVVICGLKQKKKNSPLGEHFNNSIWCFSIFRLSEIF